MTREEAIQRLKANRDAMYFPETVKALDMAIEALHREEAEEKGYCHRIIPSNVEVVVRCKDCIQKHIGGSVTHYYWCDLWDREVDGDNYCSWAEELKGGDDECV